MTYRKITLWKLNKVTVEKISVCDSEVGAWVTCKISIWFRASPDHKQSFRNIWRENHPITCELQCQWLVVKTIVVRKSLGPKGPCRFDSGLGHKGKCMTYVIDSPDVSTVHIFYWIYHLVKFPWTLRRTIWSKIWVGCLIDILWPVEVANETDNHICQLVGSIPCLSQRQSGKTDLIGPLAQLVRATDS